MGDVGEVWSGIRALRAAKRARNRDSSTEMLSRAGVHFISRNDGAHLIVDDKDGGTIDYWPGTGLWIVRGAKKRHRGIRSLLKRLSPPPPIQAEAKEEGE